MNHSDRAHSKLAPSSSHRWLVCTGSVALSAEIEETPSWFAAEGTAAHELAEVCLREGTTPVRYLYTQLKVGKFLFVIDGEMVEAVQTYLDVCRAVQAENDEFEIEQRVDIDALVPDVGGTGDVIAYSAAQRRVTIVDLKYGKGVAVEVQDNEQELTYALGVMRRYHNRGVDDARLIIVQPRAPHRDGPVREWVATADELYAHLAALKAAQAQIAAGDVSFVPGSHCKFCKAAAICKALDDKVREIIMADPLTTEFRDWREEEADIALVENWAKRRKEFAHAEAIRGRLPIGSKLVSKKAFRKWKDENSARQKLYSLGLDDSDIFETTMLSPPAIEKLLPKKSKTALAELVVKESSGTVLAPLDDPRPQVEPSNSGFEAVEIEER